MKADLFFIVVYVVICLLASVVLDFVLGFFGIDNGAERWSRKLTIVFSAFVAGLLTPHVQKLIRRIFKRN